MNIKTYLFTLFALLVPLGCNANDHRSVNAYQPKSFMQTHTVLTIKSCIENTKEKESLCLENKYGSYGSASIIKHIRNKTFVLTAAHICHFEGPKTVSQKGVLSVAKIEHYVTGHDGIRRPAEVHKVAPDYIKNGELDLCLLVLDRVDMPALRLASSAPKEGEKVYSMSAPAGVYHPPTVPFVGGYHSGNINKHHAIISAPATGGSSGSAVLNQQGRVVGVIFAVNTRFRHVTITVNHKSLKSFLDKYLKI